MNYGKHSRFEFVFIIVFLTFTFFLISGNTDAYSSPVGKITAVEGNVTVLRAKQNVVTPVKLGDPVDIGNVYRTRTNGLAEITFNNQNSLKIANNTHLEISEYIVNEKSSSSVTKLYEGKVRVTSGQDFIKKAAAFADRSRLEVHTAVAVAGIRGSTMGVAHVEGVSGAMLSVGQGYMYNPQFPDRRENIMQGTASFTASNAPPTTPVPAQQAVRQAVGIPGISHTNVVRAAIKLEAPPSDVVNGAIQGGAAANTVVSAAVREAPTAITTIVRTAVQAAPTQAGSIAVAAINAAPPAQASTILATVVQSSPEQAAAIVSEAIRSNPEQAANIIAGAVAAAPNATQAITLAAQNAGVPTTTIQQGVSNAANIVVPSPTPAPAPAPTPAPPSPPPPPPTPPSPGGGGGGGGSPS